MITNIPLDDDRVLFVEAKPSGWAGDLPIKTLLDALEAHDVPPEVWPSTPSDNKCLERALHSMRSRRSLVRPLPKNKGWSLILENAEDLDLERPEDSDGRHSHKVELTCKIEQSEFEHGGTTVRVTPAEHPAVPLIKQEYVRYRGEGDREGLFKCSQDLSYWFSQTIIPWCHGVATRSRGGSYYIMKGQYLDRLLRVVGALEDASEFTTETITVSGEPVALTKVALGGRIILKPEVATTTTIEILIDNIINECDKACDQLSEKLEKGNLGVRALKTQKTEANKTLEKLKEYESLLDMNLSDVKDRIQEVSTGIGMAELKLLGEKDEAEYGKLYH